MRTWSKSQAYPATGDLNQHEKLSPLLLRVVANIFTKRSKINGIMMWIMTTDFSEHTPRQTRRVVRFTEPMLLTRSSPRADWRDAKLRGKTLFVVRHFVTLMAGTARTCSAVFETCPIRGLLLSTNQKPGNLLCERPLLLTLFTFCKKYTVQAKRKNSG